MISRVALALIAAALVTFATIVLWDRLRQHEMGQISRIAESESYAARSRLVRNVDIMLRALRDVHVYWSTFGRLPSDQWADDATIELSHFQGIGLILWHEPNESLRYARTLARPVFDYRPTDQEWAMYEAFLEKSSDLDGERILGPYTTADGDVLLEVYFVPKNGRIDGTLIAVVDTNKALAHLLKEDSPGFAIKVLSDETVLYQRGEPAPDLPESWVRSGFIQNSVGTTWEVQHAPTSELASSMRTPAINGVLYSGLAIAALIGLLLIETGRADKRASEATMAQGKLEELNVGLEKQVENRTQALEERSRDLVTITDSVGHDLRNPLNSISANIQLLDQQYESRLGEEGSRITSKLSAGVVQMTEILDRLLSLSTVANTRFSREHVEMKALAEEIFEDLEVSDSGPAVDFFAEDVPDAMAEPVLVQILVMNLFSNALKYTRSKTDRKIMFSSKEIDGDTAYYVQDNGIGFDSDFADRVFNAFERLPGNGETDGLGLGLDIASRVVRRHEGRIWAEGRPGAGATFYFTLGDNGTAG